MTSIVPRSDESLSRFGRSSTKWRNIHHCAYLTDRSEQSSFVVEFSPVTGVLVSRLQGLRGPSIMHISLLPLNRLLEGDIPFKTELRVRLVDGEDIAQVEFRNTLTHTGRTRLLCKFYLTMPSREMPSAVSVTYHFKLEHFNCSNLLPVEKLCQLFNGV